MRLRCRDIVIIKHIMLFLILRVFSAISSKTKNRNTETNQSKPHFLKYVKFKFGLFSLVSLLLFQANT